MNSDDISTLFSPDPDEPPTLALRQGVVQSWDAGTGENAILVGGGTLVNIPSLTAESAELVADDVVALLMSGDRAVVLGKVTTPGDPGTVPSWSADIAALDQTVTTLSTVTVPAVQATAESAQTTADAAQADVAPLTPLTDIAAMTNGTTVTGATQATADTGARVVVNDPAYPGQLALYSGNAGEVDPALIRPVLGGATFGMLEMRSPDLVGGGHYAFIEMDGDDDGSTTLVGQADSIRLDGVGTIINGFASLKLGDGSDWVTVDGNIISNAELADPVITETEIWHEVGDPTTGLGTTFASGSADANYPPSFRKDSNGVVHMRGVITSTASALTTIFTLPAGYWPSAQTPGLAMPIYMNPVGSIGRVVISAATGAVQVQRLIGASSSGFQIDCSFTTR